MSIPGITGRPELSDGDNCFLSGWSGTSGELSIGKVERRRTVGLHNAAITALIKRSFSLFYEGNVYISITYMKTHSQYVEISYSKKKHIHYIFIHVYFIKQFW